MVRRPKLVVALVVVVLSSVIGLAYAGMVESLVSPDQLPGPPPVGAAAIFAVVVLGFLASAYLDRKAWNEMGTGRVDGRRWNAVRQRSAQRERQVYADRYRRRAPRPGADVQH